MPQPYNYDLGIPTFTDRLSKLANADAQFEATRIARDEADRKALAQTKAIEQRAILNQKLNAFASKPNKTSQDIMELSLYLPKDVTEPLIKAYEGWSTEKRENILRKGGQVIAALNAGKPEMATQILEEMAVSSKNAGRADEETEYRRNAELIKIKPENALVNFAITFGAIPGAKPILESALLMQKGPSDIAKSESEAEKARVEAGFAPRKIAGEIGLTEAQTKNTLNQISDRANRLGLDKDKLTSEMKLKIEEMNRKGTDLDTEAKKLINTSAMESVVSSQFAGKLNDLAGRILAEGGGKGTWNTIGKLFENLTGTQDEWTATRNEYVRLKNNYVLKNLPQGPASDKDIKFAMQALPPDNANAAYIAQFLRGMAKMSEIDSKTKDAQADWVDSVGSLGRPRKDINVKGTMVPAGTNFNEFMYNYLEKEHEKQNTKAGAEQAKPKSYYKVWVQ